MTQDSDPSKIGKIVSRGAAVVVLLGILGCTGLVFYQNRHLPAPAAPPVQPSLSPPSAITWQTVYENLPRQDLAVDALNKHWAPFRGQVVQWTGTYVRSAADQDDHGDVCTNVYLKMEPSLREVDLGFAMRPPASAAIKGWKPGTRITVKGSLLDPSGNAPPVWLKDATIVKAEPAP